MRYRELKFWDGMNDRKAVRLSVADERGGEFYMILPRENGRKWRERRDEALGIISEAMSLGLEPGEVRENEPAEI